MAKLLDLPEELLSFISEEVDTESLIPLAVSCKIFNRLAGSRYLRLIDYNRRFLHVSNSGPYRLPNQLSFSVLCNVARILGSLSDVLQISVVFLARSASESLQQLKSVVFFLRRIQHDIPSIQFTFDQSRDGTLCPLSSFNAAFENLMRQVHRTRCKSLDIRGSLPLTEGPLNYHLPPNDCVSQLLISDSFLLSQSCRDWFIKFLNSSSAISSVIAQYTDDWAQILPKIQMSSLQRLSFFGPTPGAQGSDIEVVADFSHRHPSLHSVCWGTHWTTLPRRRRRSHPPLSHIVTLKGTVSQLRHFLAFPHVLRNLQQIEVDYERPFGLLPTDSTSANPAQNIKVWDLFALLRDRPTLQKLTFPIIIPEFLINVFSGRRTPLRTKLPQISTLAFSEFQCLSEIEIVEFVRWGQKVFPNARLLDVSFVQWSDAQKSSFAQTVAAEWSSINLLKIDFRLKNVEAWIED
ncbi:hypothetical protein GYMLUDRAFT_100024 [Collybiopsis luxurians FD-317 M1]|uniref:F-box domain-containing protein n=1 Tax=Collybiopsis luxurians FD-317 M1 TaxID=944289 RepID=A0A0D0CHZ4_9AGAR|nr:hypothetical protein GYMLUDRAFT_100024 [Collybiopsis luxurians FD-317 M1]